MVGVVGDSETGITMKAILDGKSSDGREIHVMVNPSDSTLQTCDLVYVTSTNKPTFTHVLGLISGLPILTVGEDNRFLTHGGMVGLVRSADRIEIEVDLGSVRTARLKMSSRLLDLATVVANKGAL